MSSKLFPTLASGNNATSQAGSLEPIHERLHVVMTLEELKLKNAEDEAAEQAAQPEEAAEPEAQPEELNEDPEGEQPEGEEGSEEGGEVPEWLATGEQTPDGAQMPVKTHVAMKQKLKGRITEQKSELEQLREENQRLKTGAPQPAAAAPQAERPMPKVDDFYDKPDPDAAYSEALKSWMDENVERKLQTQFQRQQQSEKVQQHQRQVSAALDQHYDRAAQIVNDGLLTADEYQAAETLVRQSVESVAPGSGDIYVDAMLSSMGEGSEKVVVSLARNPSNLLALKQALQEDHTGIKAAAFMGELKGRFSGASKRVSKTPKPGATLQGQGAGSGGAEKRQYLAAHKANNRQKAFDIKRAAKARGVDVSKW